MRRALATVGVAGALTLAPFGVSTALASDAVLASGTTTTDVDEPLAEDGNDDTGTYGLIGLSGMLGLFGYKKYREHQATRTATTGTTGTAGTDGTSRRV